jgi:hypothetical protein
LDGTTNDLFFGGWSRGATKYKIWHAGNDGPNSGLNADLLDGNEASAFLTTSDTTVVKTTGNQSIDGTKTFTSSIAGNISGNANTANSATTATTATNCSRQVIAGNGLTGGGTLNSNRTLNVGAGSGISVAADTVAVDTTVIRTTGNQSIDGTKTFTSTIVGSIDGNAATATDVGVTNESSDILTYVTFVRNNSANSLPILRNDNLTFNASNGTLSATTFDGNATNCSRSVVAGNGLTGGGQLNANRTLNVGAGDGISVAADTVAVDATVVRTTGDQSIAGNKTFTGITQTNQLRVGSTTGPTGSGNGTLVVAENIHINNAGAQDNNGRFQIYVGEQEDITASTGTIRFTFSTNPTTTRTSALLKITVSWQLNNNNILNQHAIEFMAQINNNTSGVVAISDIEPIFEWRTTVASEVTFTNLNGGQCRFDVQTVVNSSPNATYKVEILSRDGRIDLSSVSKT